MCGTVLLLVYYNITSVSSMNNYHITTTVLPNIHYSPRVSNPVFKRLTKVLRVPRMLDGIILCMCLLCFSLSVQYLMWLSRSVIRGYTINQYFTIYISVFQYTFQFKCN